MPQHLPRSDFGAFVLRFPICVFLLLLFLFFRSSTSSQRSHGYTNLTSSSFPRVCVRCCVIVSVSVCVCQCVCIFRKSAEMLRGCVSCIMRFVCCSLALVAVCLITLLPSKGIAYRVHLFLLHFLYFWCSAHRRSLVGVGSLARVFIL